MTDIDSTQNSDNAGSTESEPNFRRKYEKTIEAERARADAAEAENKILMRDKTFRSAGLDPDDARVKYFVKGYEGDLDVDAIRMEAEAAGFLNVATQPSSQPNAIMPDVLRTEERIQAAGEGGDPVVPPDFSQRLAATTSQEEVRQLMESQGVMWNASV